MAQSVGEVALDIVAGKNTVSSVVKGAMDDAQNTINKGSTGISGALGKIGSVAGGVAKGISVGIGVASTAIVGLGKQAVNAYGEYEQLVGGVETLFKENASTVITNASNAYKTAGMSANEYMTTVTSFSASLLQSLGNDTVKASEMADMAITDMSDNANKMGTSMEMIQNAYQGFAKQNYTMLDNLKLGYGGTKTEMERLLADAEKISGIKYDISSYADVVDAIHVIQTEMGITGTTAKEASSTIQGSISSMKSAWTNLLTGLSDPTQNLDQLIDNLVNSITAVGANLMPRITLVLDGVVKLVSELAPKLVAEIPKIVSQVLPSILSGAIKIVDGIVQALPQLIGTLVSMLPTLLPMLIDGIVNMIVTLASSFADIIQPIIDNLPEIIISIVDALISNLPALIQGCIKLVIGIVKALPQITMALIKAIPTIIVSIVEALFSAMPILLDGFIAIFGGAWDVICGIFTPIIDFFGGLFSNAVNVISEVFTPVLDVMGAIWDGIQAVFAPAIALFSGIFNGVVNAIKNIFTPIVNFFSSTFSLAVDTIRTVFSAVTGISSAIWNSVKNVFAGVANFFSGIFSKAVSIIKSVFNPIVDFFSGIWSKITSIFSKVGEVVGNAITNVVSKAVNTVLSTAVGIINGFISAINFAISAINAIPGVEISKLKKLDVPQMEQGGVLKKGQVGLLEGNGAEAVVPLEKNTGWLTRIADMLDERMAGRGTLITPPALENVRAGNRTESHNDNQSKIDELIELIKRLLEDDNEPTPIPIYIGNELIEEYILNKNSRTVLRSGGRA
jgi:phage-related protein